jgi:co-chaperonin GroES (HSP10)
MKDLVPLNDNVLLIPYKQEMTESGILLSSQAKSHEVISICIISALGTKINNDNLKEGTIVVIPRHTGVWVNYEDFKYIMVKEHDILAILEGISYVNKNELNNEGEKV